MEAIFRGLKGEVESVVVSILWWGESGPRLSV